MKKYIQVIKVTFEDYFVYRVNFLLWRLRAFTQIVVLYFLWRAAIPEGANILGYNQATILTYILGTSVIQSIVLSSRTAGAAGQIASGDISNFLLKPVSYLKYWFARDMADKVFNLFFSVFEISFILWLLKPPLIIQKSPKFVVLAVLAIAIAVSLHFFISFLLSLVAFWAPENPWPPRFLFMVIVGFFAGGLFPLDILPPMLFALLKLLPFTYLLFFPLNIYLGKLSNIELVTGILISILWVAFFSWIVKVVFRKGLKIYAAWGR